LFFVEKQSCFLLKKTKSATLVSSTQITPSSFKSLLYPTMSTALTASQLQAIQDGNVVRVLPSGGSSYRAPSNSIRLSDSVHVPRSHALSATSITFWKMYLNEHDEDTARAFLDQSTAHTRVPSSTHTSQSSNSIGQTTLPTSPTDFDACYVHTKTFSPHTIATIKNAFEAALRECKPMLQMRRRIAERQAHDDAQYSVFVQAKAKAKRNKARNEKKRAARKRLADPRTQ
jgi:hypothetical protein